MRCRFFAVLKPASNAPARSALTNLRETLKNLESAPTEAKRIAEQKRIRAERIAEMEPKSA